MGNKEMFVLAVTLITWAGVFLYLLRLDGLAKKLERELKYREEEKPPAEKLPVENSVSRNLR